MWCLVLLQVWLPRGCCGLCYNNNYYFIAGTMVAGARVGPGLGTENERVKQHVDTARWLARTRKRRRRHVLLLRGHQSVCMGKAWLESAARVDRGDGH